jgi:hypothetical protein
MPGAGEELYVMNADGTGEKRLTFFSDPKSDHYDRYSRQMSEVHWSPDGKRLVLGHASRKNRRDRVIGSSVWILTLEDASDVIEPPRGAAAAGSETDVDAWGRSHFVISRTLRPFPPS